MSKIRFTFAYISLPYKPPQHVRAVMAVRWFMKRLFQEVMPVTLLVFERFWRSIFVTALRSSPSRCHNLQWRCYRAVPGRATKTDQNYTSWSAYSIRVLSASAGGEVSQSIAVLLRPAFQAARQLRRFLPARLSITMWKGNRPELRKWMKAPPKRGWLSCYTLSPPVGKLGNCFWEFRGISSVTSNYCIFFTI